MQYNCVREIFVRSPCLSFYRSASVYFVINNFTPGYGRAETDNMYSKQFKTTV